VVVDDDDVELVDELDVDEPPDASVVLVV